MTHPSHLATGTASPLRRHRVLAPILLLGLLHGMVHLVVFPLWQHYDEPSHLEYVLLIARRGRLPQPGDYDPAMRQEIASSMAATRFWRGLTPQSIDFWSKAPAFVGVDELTHPPLYYLLLASAVRLFAHQGVEVQLYLARFCSLGLYLVVLVAAYGLATELFHQQRRVPVLVATFLALLPPFTSRMSSVNSDVGAAAATSLLLWAAVALARRKPSAHGVALVLLLTAVCVFTKNTAGIVALAVTTVLALSYLPTASRRWLGMGLCVVCVGALALLLTRKTHAANWYTTNPEGASDRVELETPLDDTALRLGRGGEGPWGITQELPIAEGQALRGHTITLAGWVRANPGTGGRVLFSLDDGTGSQGWAVEATSDWHFEAFTVTVALNAPGVAVQVSIPDKPEGARQVYLDGLILVDSVARRAEQPQIVDAAATRVVVGGREWKNLLRNGSAHRTWPGLPRLIGDQRLARSSAAQVFYSTWDLTRTGWVYGIQVRMLFKSFWGTFGWNQLVLPEGAFYALGALSAIALGGVAVAFARRLRLARPKPACQVRPWLLLCVALLIGWGTALLRIHPVFLTMKIWWSMARYADVVIVPTAVLLCYGWEMLVPRRWAKAASWIGLAGLLALDMLSLGQVILPYYYG